MATKYTFAQQTCIKKSGLALQRAAPLGPGCRVGVAVSGGVDSLVMLKVLKIRQGIVPFAFAVMALHINPGFNPDDHKLLASWLGSEGIAAHIETGSFGPVAHSDQNRKRSPCFLCAWHRRKRLFELCAQYKLTHLAIGHNADDLADTFLLNLFRNGRVAGLPIGEKFFNGALTVIRPLLLVEKKYIRQAARQWDLPVWLNACPSSGKTARQDANDLLATINQSIPGARRAMINGLMRWQLEKETKP